MNSTIRNVCVLILCVANAHAAQFLTDNPDPGEPGRWEFWTSTQCLVEKHEVVGQAPMVEIDYGFVRDFQVHVAVPTDYSLTSVYKRAWTASRYGIGDTEFEAKYRFLHETDSVPQAAFAPIVEIPTGNRGLGNGKAQLFLPFWLQKSFGKWTTYGGGGYWLNWGRDNRNYGHLGWVGQRKIGDKFTLSAEMFHIRPSVKGGPSDTGSEIGGAYDVSKFHHVIFSGGRDISGPRKAMGYLGYQITF